MPLSLRQDGYSLNELNMNHFICFVNKGIQRLKSVFPVVTLLSPFFLFPVYFMNLGLLVHLVTLGQRVYPPYESFQMPCSSEGYDLRSHLFHELVSYRLFSPFPCIYKPSMTFSQVNSRFVSGLSRIKWSLFIELKEIENIEYLKM